MSDIIKGFKEKIYDIKEQVDKASKSIQVEKFIKLEQQHKLAIKSIEEQKQAEIESINEELEKRMKLLTSNRDKIDEYDKYVEAAQIQYTRKENDIISKYQKNYDSENEKYSVYKEEENKELEDSKRNLCEKKFDELKEKEINSLMADLDSLSKDYAKEKEELEEKYKEKTKIAKEEFSSDGINKLECIYIPEDERKRIASYVLSGFLPTKLIDDKEILIGDEIGKRKVEDEKSNEESKTESDFRKINEEKFSEIEEAIKQLKSLKFEDIEQEILNDDKTKEEIDEQDDFDSQER